MLIALWALHRQLIDAKTPAAKELLQRKINATDRQIDRLVYELYGLLVGACRIGAFSSRR